MEEKITFKKLDKEYSNLSADNLGVSLSAIGYR